MKSIRGLDLPTTLAELVDPRRCALVIYDMQVGIIGQISHGEEIVRQVGSVLQGARQAGMRIIFTRHLSLPKELMGAAQYRMAMAWQKLEDPEQVQPWFLRDAPGFAIMPELQPLASEAIFDKITMSAFEGTPLNITLRDCGITSFIVVGVATEIGIDPTCRHGSDLGYVPILVEDACGAGHTDAAARSIDNLRFLGDTVFTDTTAVIEALAAL